MKHDAHLGLDALWNADTFLDMNWYKEMVLNVAPGPSPFHKNKQEGLGEIQWLHSTLFARG